MSHKYHLDDLVLTNICLQTQRLSTLRHLMLTSHTLYTIINNPVFWSEWAREWGYVTSSHVKHYLPVVTSFIQFHNLIAYTKRGQYPFSPNPISLPFDGWLACEQNIRRLYRGLHIDLWNSVYKQRAEIWQTCFPIEEDKRLAESRKSSSRVTGMIS